MYQVTDNVLQRLMKSGQDGNNESRVFCEEGKKCMYVEALSSTNDAKFLLVTPSNGIRD